MKVIGIDFGGTNVKLALLDDQMNIIADIFIKTARYHRVQMVEKIVVQIQNWQKEFTDIIAVGVGVPGFVARDGKTIIDLPNVPGWQNIPLAKEITDQTMLPCLLENDANCMAYGEWKLGKAKNFQNAICITLGTGVGAGIISNGKIIAGGGELGQTSICYREEKSNYGTPGILESYVGIKAISEITQDYYAQKGIVKTMAECAPHITAKLAEEGQQEALAVWEKVAKYLAIGIVNTIWLLKPEALIIGGGISAAAELFMPALKKEIAAMMPASFIEDILFLVAQFGNKAGVIGAALLALEEVTEAK